jgi:hypothetical protein
MKDPVKALFDAGILQKTAFPPESRHHGIATKTLERPDGTSIAYLKRRFVPAPERFAAIAEHRVREGERLDNLAAALVGDPEQFWRLCDANGVLKPEELEVTGRRIRITLPEGVPPQENVGA